MRVTRRQFITTATAGLALAARRPSAVARAQAGKPITVAHSVSTFVYGQHLVAKEKKFFEDEGVTFPSFIVPGGGARVVNALTAGQAMFGLGDSNHPLKATEKGRETVILFATDTRCSYANIVVRKELWDKGVRSVEALADQKLVGRRAVIAMTSPGSGTHVYGTYVLKQTKAPDGKSVNDHVDWIGGGASTRSSAGSRQGSSTPSWPCPSGSRRPRARGSGRSSTTSRTRRRGTACSAARSR